MQKTFVVLGNYRGGTSAVAGLLRIFGVFMGKRFDPANNHEDLEFQMKDVQTIKRLIEKRNIDYEVWGWKDPATIDKIESLIEYLCNPHFIVVFRDPYAVALSEFKHQRQDIIVGLNRANIQNTKLVDFCSRYNSYPLSYEKLLLNTKKEVSRLADYCGIKMTKEVKEKALKFIGPGRYLTIP